MEIFVSTDYGFDPTEKIEFKKRFISYAFAFSFIWSIGGSISEEYYEDFSGFVKKEF